MTTSRAARRIRRPAVLLMQVRTLHTWIGMLIAPTVLFMATTGTLQLYSLHESHPGYTAPALLEKLGMLHKDQVFTRKLGPPPGFRFPRGLRPPGMAGAKGGPGFGEGPPRGEGRGPKPAVLLLKAFFTAAAVGLIVSTLLGIWMALRDGQKRVRNLVLLLVGAAVPVVLAALTA